MSKQLPSIFKNPTNKKIENNKNVFYSKYEQVGNVVERKEEVTKENDIDLEESYDFTEALDSLFKNNHFVFNVPVEIVMKNNTLHTKIISKVGDHLLTSNNTLIQLDEILSIRIKDIS